jgi:cell division transport system ATP-binding protein
MIKFVHVTKTYGKITALKEASFEVKNGEFVFLTGPSGAGKTTILKLILGEILPDTGQVMFGAVDVAKLKEKDLPKLRQRIGCVFQDYKLLNEKTVGENVEIALAILGTAEEKWPTKVVEVLKETSLLGKKDYFPAQLSGGELQRVALARALVVEPELILADEPTGNLDWDTADGIMKLLEKINKKGKTIIMATHNREIVAKMKKREIKLKESKVL